MSKSLPARNGFDVPVANVIAAAQSLDCPKLADVTVLCRVKTLKETVGKERTRDYELTVVAGYLFDNTINILKMICSGFLDRWPTLKLLWYRSSLPDCAPRGSQTRPHAWSLHL